MSDAAVRLQALDPETSFIVQAPAGSGKTELLIQRYLTLLSRVDAPESIVAITFTKKAAGEMRLRVLEALQMAERGEVPETTHHQHTFALAQAALRRDRAAGWRLLRNPARMRIQTIDSLSASITRQMPWLARFGAPPDITEKAGPLYAEAARNLLRTVETEEEAGEVGPLSTLLLHLDNNFRSAERLIANMLERRDQWLRHTGVAPDMAAVREQLEGALARLVEGELAALRGAFPPDIVRDIVWLLEVDGLPVDLPGWLRLAEMALTKDGKIRKKVPPGFKADRWQRVVACLERDGALHHRVKELRRLPPTVFEDRQWATMEALVDTLPKAVAELTLVFREHGTVDFAELSIAASYALGHLESPSDLALALGHRIEHLLVDEFQDTSFTQFELLAKLTAGRASGDGRTLFLVGDPMQSIYRFREADVGLFLKARNDGIGDIALTPLTLQVNFRSDASVLEWVNDTFGGILPTRENVARGAVPYSASVANRPASDVPPTVHPFFGESQAEEAGRIVELVQAAEGTVAILVRSRSHLTQILPALRRAGIGFEAIEIDGLGERPVVQDLMALTFALLHPADRIAWLGVLRAPWIGLKLGELHALVAVEPHTPIWDLIRRTKTRGIAALEAGISRRGRDRLRVVVEQTWLALGGPACVESDGDLADSAAYLDLLEGLEQAGDLADFELLREQVAELFAQPDSHSDGRLQIMTIHKAKGLEFDNVILPGLGQRGRGDDDELLVWHEQEGDLLLAPMRATGEDKDPIYDYLAHLGRDKTRLETARLLYVAATRARNRLHLLGCARVNDATGEVTADGDTFLRLLWPAVGQVYRTAAANRTQRRPMVGEAARTVRRLVADWSLPAPPKAVAWKAEVSETAGEEQGPAFDWVGATLRHVGTTLHAFLQRGAWTRSGVEGMLAGLGVTPVELTEAADRVEKALRQTLADERGRWALTSHAEAINEYSITGMVDGQVYSAKIDRTFVDESGVRWIIDYKTSMHEGGGLENFLEEERRRHAPQLERYARLMAQWEERPIRLGLYFPLLGEWLEWGAPTLVRHQASLFD